MIGVYFVVTVGQVMAQMVGANMSQRPLINQRTILVISGNPHKINKLNNIMRKPSDAINPSKGYYKPLTKGKFYD